MFWPHFSKYGYRPYFGGKHCSDPMAVISIRLVLGFGLGLVRGEVWLLSMLEALIGTWQRGSEYGGTMDQEMTFCC